MSLAGFQSLAHYLHTKMWNHCYVLYPGKK